MFIAKYDSSGVFKWAEKAGAASQTDYGCCIVADSNNVFVSGNFQSGFGAFGTTNFVGNSFLAKYNSAGTFQWVNNLGSNGSPRPYAMTMDNLHNIYITGRAGGTFTYGTTNLGTDANNIFIARYNYSGTCTLVKTTGGTVPNNSYDIALDSDRNIYITGSFSETCAFWNSISLVSSGFKDAFLAKYDTTGCLWAIKAGGTSQDEGCGLFVAGNYVYFTGQFLGSVIFPGTTMPLTSYGDVDIFIAKYNKNTYSKYFVESAGGASGDLGREIIVFNDTNIYVTGANGPAANFGQQFSE